MSARQVLESFTIDASPAVATGFNPYYRAVDRMHAAGQVIDGRRFVDLASNDYLGIAAHPRLTSAMTDAVRRYGASLCGTPIATGYASLLASLEHELAAFAGVEDSVVFPSCYQANCALFETIAGPADLVLVDHFAHASLIHGIRTCGCVMKPFLHNNMAHLERMLAAQTTHGKVYVVTESVFSTEGSIAPLDRIVQLCERHGAVPVVDDSHGIGVLGAQGHGILQEKRLAPFDGIYTASLGKALAGLGGVVGGPARFVEFLRYRCAGLIYSTALPPACAAAVRAALGVVADEFAERSARLQANRVMLSSALHEAGFEVVEGQSPIASVACGSAEDTFALCRDMFARGVFSTAFVPPSVPPNAGRVRLIPGAKLGASEMERVVAAVSAIGKAVHA